MGEARRVLIGCAIGIGALAAIAVTDAAAQSSEPDERRHAAEVTPFVSMGSDMSSRIGAAVAFAWTEALSGEIEVGYREGAVSTSFSVLYHLPSLGRARPYLAAGAGLEQLDAPVFVPGGGVASRKRAALVVNAGGGVKVPVTETVGYRADARWSNAVGRQPEKWRLYNGVTVGVGGR